MTHRVVASIPLQTLAAFCGDVLRSAGVPSDAAALVTRSLCEADARGIAMAGSKGAGLALMIDLLCGVLSGAAFGPHIVDLYDTSEAAQDVGHLFAAIDVETFMPLAMFRRRVAQFVAEVRSQPRLPGIERIYLPGELELDAAELAAREGIPVSEAGRSELDMLAARYGVTPFRERLLIAARFGGEATMGHAG